ncbi:MAG: FkbM family methyltransferase [Pseudomonadota bacterium]
MRLWQGLKAVMYRAGMVILRFLWYVNGGRRIIVFGEDYRLVPETIFPSYRKFKLPRGRSLSEIVRYADYVQFHVIVNYIEQLKDKPIVVDIGAHHGAYAVVLGKIVRQWGGKVLAVEPNPESYRVLSRNIQLNGLEEIVICKNVAVSDKNGSMYISELGVQSKITQEPLGQGYRVDVVTMESLLKNNAIDHIHILIIDVEGAELPVLQSLPWKRMAVDKIFCELHPYAWKDFGYTGDDVRYFLAEHGYRCFDMYFKEHTTFDSDSYIGPILFVHETMTGTNTDFHQQGNR